MRKQAPRIERRSLLTVMVALTLCLSILPAAILVQSLHGTENTASQVPTSIQPIPANTLVLTPHDSIFIDGDSNFTAENGVTRGSGIAGDPYVVEGWTIDASSFYAIEVTNTNSFFIVRNLQVHNSSGSAVGVLLWNVSNAVVELVAGTNLSSINVFYCHDVTVQSNELEGNDCRVYLTNSQRLRVENNRIVSENHGGIRLELCSNFTVAENNVMNCTFGVYATDCSDGLIVRNNVSNQVEGGSTPCNIWIDESSNLSVYHNNFLNPYDYGSNGAADFSRVANIWDNGYPSGGNYWADITVVDLKSGPNQDQPGGDGIGDTPKYISNEIYGPDMPSDHYPLMKPWTSSWGSPDGEPSTPTLPELKVGVKAGDWVKYKYSVSGWPAGTPYPDWLKVEFLTVEGTNFTVRVTMHLTNGTDIDETMTMDFVSGGEAVQGLTGFVIPANCTTDNSIYISGLGNRTISGEMSKTYAGARRTAVYTSFSQYGTQLRYYWDKETGVMLEASTTFGTISGTAKVTETNMWEAQSSGVLANSTVLYALVIAAIVIVVAVAFLVMRRRKELNQTIAEEEEPPTSPPGT